MKIVQSFSVNKDIFEEFKAITEALAINKSRYIEMKMIEFIKENKNKVLK